MSGENSQKLKKVDYSVISQQKCPDCGEPLKQNKVLKEHRYCYVCFKLRNGKKYAYCGEVIKRDFRKEQAKNRQKNNFTSKRR